MHFQQGFQRFFYCQNLPTLAAAVACRCIISLFLHIQMFWSKMLFSNIKMHTNINFVIMHNIVIIVR
jgi:hypothetical protein